MLHAENEAARWRTCRSRHQVGGVSGIQHPLLDLHLEKFLESVEEEPGVIHNPVIKMEDAARAEQSKEFRLGVFARDGEYPRSYFGRANVSGFATADLALLVHDIEKARANARPASIAQD